MGPMKSICIVVLGFPVVYHEEDNIKGCIKCYVLPSNYIGMECVLRCFI